MDTQHRRAEPGRARRQGGRPDGPGPPNDVPSRGSGTPFLPDDGLFRRLRTGGDADARRLLVERHLPLAHALAGRYRNRGVSTEDLVQVAALGLVLAVDRFDPGRGLSFRSFAVPTILGEIKRYFRDRSWRVRPPRRLQESYLRVREALPELTQQLRRPPSTADLAAHLLLPEDEVVEAIAAGDSYRTVRLDDGTASGQADDGAVELGTEDEELLRAPERVELPRLLAALPAAKREVVRLSFGHDLTQREIGRRVGVSQVQVSRLLAAALVELRTAAMAGSDEREGLR